MARSPWRRVADRVVHSVSGGPKGRFQAGETGFVEPMLCDKRGPILKNRTLHMKIQIFSFYLKMARPGSAFPHTALDARSLHDHIGHGSAALSNKLLPSTWPPPVPKGTCVCGPAAEPAPWNDSGQHWDCARGRKPET